MTVPFGKNKPASVVVMKKTPGFGDAIAKQVAGVDRSGMGVYRALAELSMESVKANNMEQATKLVYLLDRVWEESSGPLQKSDAR